METKKTLLDQEDIEIEGKKFFISRIPAVQAQRLFLAGFSAFSNMNMNGLPPAMMEELLSYCGTYNGEGVAVQFINADVINMFVTDMFVLLSLEHAMVRKNYSFLFDGRGVELATRLASIPQGSESKNTVTSTP